jgi:hypothetical protein
MIKFNQFITEEKSRKSFFDGSIPVAIYYKNDAEYPLLKDNFKEYGWCIGIPEHKAIIWDGEAIRKLDKDQITWIESHELAHFKLGKDATETDCDWWGIASCWRKGLKTAAKAGIDVFGERNGMEFDTEDLDGYDKWIGGHKKLAEAFIAECIEKNIDVLSALKSPEKYGLKPLKVAVKTAWEIYTEQITTK